MALLQYENYLLGADSNDENIGENNAMDQTNGDNSLGEPSIKPEIDIDTEIKTEHFKYESNKIDDKSN